MRALKIMNTKEKEVLLKQLNSKFGLDVKQFQNLVFMQDSTEIWISTKDCLTQKLDGLSVESVGLLFARKKPKMLLTVNAVQLYCSNATKNTLPLDRNNALEFIQGHNLTTEKPDGLYTVKHNGRALDLGLVEEGLLRRKSLK